MLGNFIPPPSKNLLRVVGGGIKFPRIFYPPPPSKHLLWGGDKIS